MSPTDPIVPPSRASDPKTQEADRLVLEIGQALHRFGTAAHRIELILERLCARLGMEGHFFAVPTAIIAAFGPLGEQRSGMVRLAPGAVDLGKLAALDEEIQAVLRSEPAPAEELTRVRAIVAQPPPYPPWLQVLCFGLASGAGAVFFGGRWVELLASLLIGLGLGAVVQFGSGGARRHVFVPVAGALAGALAPLGQLALGPYHADVVVISGLLPLLPGLTLTVALTELSTRHLVSGTARLTMAVLVLLELAFGVAVGGQVAPLVSVPTPAAGSAALPLAEPATVVALLIASSCYVVLFRARLRESPWILLACLLSFYGSRLAAHGFEPHAAAWLGALGVGLACNAYARWMDRPPIVLLVPAILLLVPGSIGFRSVTWLLRHETVKAVDAAFDMVLVGMALAVGLLVANVLLSPRRDL